MHHACCIVSNKGTNEVISSNTTLFITNGSTQLHVSATKICHHHVVGVHRAYRIDISHMCIAIGILLGGVHMGCDLAMCRWWGILVWQLQIFSESTPLCSDIRSLTTHSNLQLDLLRTNYALIIFVMYEKESFE
jgi:hypothetical protein